MVESVWIPPIEVKKLWTVEKRGLINSEEILMYRRCTGKLSLTGTFNVAIKCDLDFASYPFDRQVREHFQYTISSNLLHV